MAHKLAQNGVTQLSLLDVNDVELRAVHEAMRQKYPSIEILLSYGNVAHESDVSDAVKRTVQEFSRIDIAVHSAGVGDVSLPTHQVPLDAWRRIIETNQTGTWLCQRAVINQMLGQEYVPES